MAVPDTQAQREAIVAHYRDLIASGLGTGSSGNLSTRVDGGMLITPTGILAEQLSPDQLVHVSLAGDVAEGQLRPSSEWHMHAVVYRDRPEIEAVVHCHSRYATILACAHKPIPAIHYMIAVTQSGEIPVAPYATFGTNALAESVIAGLAGRLASLLANHGQIAIGHNLEEAMRVAREVEELASIYWGSLAIGGGRILDKQEMSDVQAAFTTYGQQSDA
ncbi:MAG: class II aldolase/adducin family protein [Halioglobus sp.]